MRRFFLIPVLAVTAVLALSCRQSSSGQEADGYQMSYEVEGQVLKMEKMPAGYLSLGLSTDNRKKFSAIFEPRPVLLDGFVISSEPVSAALWATVMGKGEIPSGQPLPADRVSWEDVSKFISKLNALTGRRFSLPTEAQWEYALEILGKDRFVSVGEWCADSFTEEGEDAPSDGGFMRNPKGPVNEEDVKVVRTVAERIGVGRHTRKAKVGFRLVQPTEDVLSEEMISHFEGKTAVRETVEAGSGGKETVTAGDVSFRMVKVRGGEFSMGFRSTDSPYRNYTVQENELPLHKVSLDDFEIGETEVTVGLWKEVMGSVPRLNDPAEPDKAVGNISWYDAQAFILKLNSLTGRKFRLPTEAEWEYAARGGNKSRYFGFSGSNSMDAAMWYYSNSGNGIHGVALKQANELGIYDMSGNVWEWCLDPYAEYSEDHLSNPVASGSPAYRTLRGGSYASKWSACRISNRSKMPPKNIKGSFGLRLAL